MLFTFAKDGVMVDSEIVGTSGYDKAFEIESLADDCGFNLMQYNFEIESYLVGNCDILVYKVAIGADGKIDKSLLREEKKVYVNMVD